MVKSRRDVNSKENDKRGVRRIDEQRFTHLYHEPNTMDRVRSNSTRWPQIDRVTNC